MLKPGFRRIKLIGLFGAALAMVGVLAPWAHISLEDATNLPGRIYDIAGSEPSAGGWVALALAITACFFALLLLVTGRREVARVTAWIAMAMVAWGIYRGLRLRSEIRSIASPEFGSDAQLAWGLVMFGLGSVVTMLGGAAAGMKAAKTSGRETVSYDDGRAIREDA